MDWNSEHRLWPPPNEPWIMYQQWNGLLFMHYEVPKEKLRSIVPDSLHLDTYQGRAFVSVTPFHMTGVRPRGIPALPGVSAFPELNFRTYVVIDDKPGIYFFSLDAGNSLAVEAARGLWHLPYFNADMEVRQDGAYFWYRSRRVDERGAPAELRLAYRPVGEVFRAERGSLEYFLAERYCLYAVHELKLYRCEIHHEPWPLQNSEAQVEINTMGDQVGLDLSTLEPILHFASVQPTVIYPIHEITASPA